jgi:hypothetical protein
LRHDALNVRRLKHAAAALLVMAVAAGCARTPASAPPAAAPEPAAESFHRLALPPEPAAACVAGNVAVLGERAVAHLQPLYGTERLAVIMRERPAGEALAVAYVTGDEGGSQVRIAPTLRYTGEPGELARRLVAGC